MTQIAVDNVDASANGHDHPSRMALASSRPGRAVRVPSGVTVFDAASWNGIAIDSTCGGHGTCKKCRVRVVDGQVPVTALDAHAFREEELAEGWRLRAAPKPRPTS